MESKFVAFSPDGDHSRLLHLIYRSCSVFCSAEKTGADLFHVSKHTKKKPNYIAFQVETQKSRGKKMSESKQANKISDSEITLIGYKDMESVKEVWWVVTMTSQTTEDVLSRRIYCSLMHQGLSKTTMVQPVFHRENRTNCCGTRNVTERCQVESRHSTVIWGHNGYIDYPVYVGKIWLFQHFNYI